MTHTKGNFIDGTTGWKVADCITNGSVGYEIHFNDDGECVTDHVYELADAKLIAAAPELLEALIKVREWYEQNQRQYLGEYTPVCFSEALDAIKKAV